MEGRLTDMTRWVHRATAWVACLTLILGFFFTSTSYAATAKEIEAGVKAGFGIGAEYGEGALRIGGKTVEYYSIAAGSIGLQIGAQKKNVILAFMDNEALKKFRASSGWKAGVDGSVAAINVGAGASVDTVKINEPIVSFIFGQRGLMANATIEGSKFTKLER